MKTFNQSDIIISDSPGYARGLRGVQSLRILIFITLPDAFSIDFTDQKPAVQTAYIIPPGHFCFLSEEQSCSFWCIDFYRGISGRDADLLLALKYQNRKGILLDADAVNFLSSSIDQELKEVQCVLLMNRVITDYQRRINCDLADFDKNLILAKRLLHFLCSAPEKLDVLTIVNIAQKLNCSERTLLRCCKSVFGLTTKELLKKHFVLISLYMFRFSPSVSAVARDLGFADSKTFIRFIKNELRQTPKQISQVLYSS